MLGLIHQGDNMALKMLDKLGVDLKDHRARVTRELQDHPETDRDMPPAERERLQLRLFLRNDVQGLLDTVDDRLSAIERHLGISRPASAALRGLGERIAQVRRDKDAAIEGQDFGKAAALRDAENQLIDERLARLRKTAEQDLAAAAASQDAEPAEGAEPAADELSRQQARIARLEALLREHGIDPDEPREPPAAAG